MSNPIRSILNRIAMAIDPDDPFGPERPEPPATPPTTDEPAETVRLAATPTPSTPISAPTTSPAPAAAGASEPAETVRLSPDADPRVVPPSRAGVFHGFDFDRLPSSDVYVPGTAPAQGGDTVRLGPAADPDATVRLGGSASGQASIEPVVGWLVVTTGPWAGRDFRLLAGRTSIGRDASMDVALTADPRVSRERHALVTYDPRSNQYRLVPGDGSGLVYLNGDAVDVPTTLSAHDRIEVGETTLVFVPLCGDAFRWGA